MNIDNAYQQPLCSFELQSAEDQRLHLAYRPDLPLSHIQFQPAPPLQNDYIEGQYSAYIYRTYQNRL